MKPDGSGLVYSTYLGGSSDDEGRGIAVDGAGSAYVTGLTLSTNFPTTGGAFQTSSGGLFFDAFVTKVNALASGLVYSTYLGGSGSGSAFGFSIAVDGAGNAYVTGLTASTTFPTTPNAIQPTSGGGNDGFVTALNPLGTGLVYSSYLGGGAGDEGLGIALDASFSVYVTGETNSSDFPTTPGAFRTTAPGGGNDAFVTKIAGVVVAGPQPTTLTFTAANATTSDFNDAAQVQAQLTTTGGAPVPNETVTFTLGSGSGAPTCSATTDATGTATCLITPNQAAGPVTLTATFAGDATFGGSSASTTFTVTKEETTLKFTASSSTVLANGQPAAFSATLREDGTTPISGRSVTITLGSGTGAQSCTGTTDSSGTATCTIAVNQPLGPNNVAANFSGDAFYRPSSDTEAVVVFTFLGSGSFVIGDLNAAVGNGVTFWSEQWAKANSLSGGPPPSAFKGFADTAPQSCGGSWSSSPGNSSNPPGSVPSFMAVIASSSITKSGSTISGDVPKFVVVQTNPGYGSEPGHTGTGTVVSVVCGR